MARSQYKELKVSQQLVSRMKERLHCQNPNCERFFAVGDSIIRTAGGKYYCHGHFFTDNGGGNG